MTDDRISADDVAGAVAGRKALGEDAESAVIAAFLEKTGRAIDDRVDARIAERTGPLPAPTPHRDRSSFVLALFSVVLGIPLTAIATAFKDNALAAVVVIWAAIAIINVAYNRQHRQG